MSGELREVMAAFSQIRTLVIGEAMLDSYLQGVASRLCREAPVPVVEVEQRIDEPGGGANTAVNVQSLGGRVRFLSVIGDDAEGMRLQATLQAYGLNTDHVLVQPARRTLAKQRILAGEQLLVRFDQGSTERIDERTERVVIDRLHALMADCDAVIVSDYGYGVMTERVIDTLAMLQARAPRMLVVDSKHLPCYRNIGATAVKPNYDETLSLLGQSPRSRLDAEQMMSYGANLLEATGARMVAATLDAEGAIMFERGSVPYRTYARASSHAYTTGAGDTFVSALTLALAAGASPQLAAEVASAAAGVVVGKQGTATCTLQELKVCLAAGDKYVSDLQELSARVADYRQQGRRIVFTNGCFDILHHGHIELLNRAKALGDVLVVGLNSDQSVARLKGPQRPINNLEHRAHVLTALSCVDHAVAFEEDTPAALIRAIRPDVFVKGGDYTRQALPEAPIVEALGGEVHILPYLGGFSTTGIIRRIRDLDEDSKGKSGDGEAGCVEFPDPRAHAVHDTGVA